MRPVTTSRDCLVRLVPLPAPGTELHQQWKELAETTEEPVPFNEPAFVLAAARALDKGRRVRLLLAADDHGMTFALPVLPVWGYRGLPTPGLAAWHHDYCYLASPLVRPGAAEHAWTAVIRYATGAWRWLILEGLAADGPGWDGLQTALRLHAIRPTERQRHDRAVARRRPRADYLEGRVRGIHLKGFRRQRHLLGPDVKFRVRTGDPAAVEEFLDLESAGWKGRDGGAMAVRPGHAQLLRDVVRDAPDTCDVYSLEAGGRAVAVQVNLRRGDVSSCFKTTYDQARRQSSPGLLLMLDVLAAFHADKSLQLLDSCAVAGHPMAERLLPDRRPLVNLLVPLSRSGRVSARGVPVIAAATSRFRHRLVPS